MKSRIYVIFPYLNTFQKFSIEGIEFKGIFDEGEKIVNNLTNEDKNDQYHLNKILGSFRLSENYPIQRFTYAIQDVNTQDEFQDLKNRIQIAANIIRYKLFAMSSPGRNSSFSQTTLYVFELSDNEWKSQAKKLRSGNEFLWYRGSRDFTEQINIHWPREKIYSPKNRMSLEYIQFFDKSSFLLKALDKTHWKSRDFKEEERFRIIRAIEHYNKSYSEGAGVDERDRILSLTAGFEALLSLPDECIQQSFRSVVVTLLGDVANLGQWSLEFYNLRSKIVHGEEISKDPRSRPTNKEKRTPSLYFKHAEGEYEYIKHLEIGQHVFEKCLDAILRQRTDGYIADIISLLEPNEVHIKRIEEELKLLKDKSSISGWHKSGLFDEYGELQTKDNTAKPEKIVNIGNELLTLLKKYLQDKKAPLDKQIDDVLNFKGKYIDLAMVYSTLYEEFENIYLGNGTIRNTIEDYALENAAYMFLLFASHVLFSFSTTD